MEQCGLISYYDFVEVQAGAAAALMQDLDIRTISSSLLPTHRTRNVDLSTALPFGSTSIRRQRQDIERPQGPQVTRRSAQNETVDIQSTDQAQQNRMDQAYVLGCIDGRFNQPTLFHLPWNPATNDRDLFLQLQRQYMRTRGSWRCKLSLWALQAVLFIQVP